MISRWKHVYCTLLALSLSFVLFACGAAYAQEAAVAPPPADSKAVTDADFIAAADEVLGQMSQFTGL
jgi:hypothetical protein